MKIIGNEDVIIIGFRMVFIKAFEDLVRKLGITLLRPLMC